MAGTAAATEALEGRRAALDAHVELHRTRQRRRALRTALGVVLALFVAALALVQVDEARARARGAAGTDGGADGEAAETSEAASKALLVLLTLRLACGVGPSYEGDHAAWIAAILILVRVALLACVAIAAQTLRATTSLMAVYAKKMTGSVARSSATKALTEAQAKLLGLYATTTALREGFQHRQDVARKCKGQQQQQKDQQQQDIKMTMNDNAAMEAPMTPEVRRKVAYSSPGSAATYGVRRRKGAQFRSSPSLQSPGYTNRPTSSGASLYLAALRSSTPGNKSGVMGTPSSVGTPLSATCPNCASPLQGSPYLHGSSTSSLSDMDEAAYLLLQSLTVDWNPSVLSSSSSPSTPRRGVQCVANVIDDWTDNLTRALSKYARENIIEPLERNARHLVELNSQVFSQSVLDQSLQAPVQQPLAGGQQGLMGLGSLGAGMEMQLLQQQQQQAMLLQQQQQQQQQLLQQQQQQQPLELARQRAMNYYTSMVAQQGNNQQAVFQAQQDMSMINRLLDERARLERSLVVVAAPLVAAGRGTYTRATVLAHLKSLFGSPDRLSKYQWDAASPPCDADILIHLATDWLKRTMHLEDNRQVFLANSRRDLPEPGLFAEQQRWGLERITVPAPDGHSVPHFQLYFQGRPWKVRSGRQNALQAIALLVYSMKVLRSPGIESVEWVVGGHSFAPL